MKAVKNLMINKWKMKDVDWMGYKLQKDDSFSFHHLIVPNRNGGPYAEWNGAILCSKTSHPYLHTIERVDYDKFLHITSLLIEENIKGELDVKIIEEIDGILKEFEKDHYGDITKKGKKLIKQNYLIRDYTSLY